jgi:hypothetical protein
VEKTDPTCSNIPVCVVLSIIITPGLPPKKAKAAGSFKEEKIEIPFVNVPVPIPATFTVAVPEFPTAPVNGAGPGTTFAVSPVSVTVTNAFVNGDPPRVPVAVVERLYVIAPACTCAIEHTTATNVVKSVRVIQCPPMAFHYIREGLERCQQCTHATHADHRPSSRQFVAATRSSVKCVAADPNIKDCVRILHE